MMLNLDRNQIGNKAYNLTQLERIIPGYVPPFCPLSDAMIQRHLDQTMPEWRELWKKFQTIQATEQTALKKDALLVLEKLRNDIQRTFEQHPFKDESLDAYLLNMNGQLLMVRSTGIEDAQNEANPGGNESLAAVPPTPEAVSKAIGIVVASYFSEKSLTQRLKHSAIEGHTASITETAFIPVLIQQMIGEGLQEETIVYSGVMYTDAGNVVIEAAPGHCELVVNCKGAFDSFYVTKKNGVYATLSPKPYRLHAVKPGKFEYKVNPEQIQCQAALSNTTLIELAHIGKTIEEAYDNIPMDIEFIYEPKKNKIHIVQTREQPHETPGKIARSVPPELMPKLKNEIKQGHVQQLDARVITPAGYRAHVITNEEEFILCDTMEEALTHYLKKEKKDLKVIFVKYLAASTSHISALFNANGLPVIQINANNFSTIQQWITQASFCFIADVQRDQLLNIPSAEKAEAEKWLKEGLFKHPVKYITPLPVKLSEAECSRFFKKLDPHLELKKISYSHILIDLEKIATIQPNADNKIALTALTSLKTALYHLAKAFPEILKFLPQFFLLCEEIENAIHEMSKSAENFSKQHDAYLELMAILNGLITAPGTTETFSQSLKQVVQEKKIQANMSVKADGPLVNYLTQFFKLTKISFLNETVTKWNAFSTECIKSMEATQKLAEIITFYMRYHLECDLINQFFLTYYEQYNGSSEEILKQLCQDYTQAKTELEDMQLDQKINLIRAWGKRRSEWESEKDFDALWKDYEKDISPLIDQINFHKPCDLITMGSYEFEQQENYKHLPGDSHFAFVFTKDNAVYHVDKKTNTKTKLQPHGFTFNLSQYQPMPSARLPCLPQDAGEHRLANAYDIAFIKKVFNYTYDEKNVHLKITSTALTEKEMLAAIPTEIGYVISDEKIYFIDKIYSTCERIEWLDNDYINQFINKLGNGYDGKFINVLAQDEPWIEFLEIQQQVNTNYHSLAQKVILNVISELTEMMDQTIKAVKGSASYQNQQLLLVKRFKKMLEPYLKLMANWMSVIPNQKYDAWASYANGHDREMSTKFAMINHILSGYASAHLTPTQLYPSGNFSVDAASIGVSNFSRAFIKKKNITLEDLFSLTHQNIKKSCAILKKYAGLTTQYLPEKLRGLCSEFEEKKIYLESYSYQYPQLTLEFYFPLANHGAKFQVQYDHSGQSITFDGCIYGGDWLGRMAPVVDAIALMGSSFDFTTLKKPKYDSRTTALEWTWAFPITLLDSKLPTFTRELSNFDQMLDTNPAPSYRL